MYHLCYRRATINFALVIVSSVLSDRIANRIGANLYFWIAGLLPVVLSNACLCCIITVATCRMFVEANYKTNIYCTIIITVAIQTTTCYSCMTTASTNLFLYLIGASPLMG